jgi:Na+/melibiose symporter-like transporter
MTVTEVLPQSEAAVEPTTGRLSARVKWAFATGGAADTLGHWLYFNLADPVYSSYFHLSPTQIGNVKAATLIADAFAGVLFGWLSDNTRSRWGRRRPYILVGSLLSGLALPLLFLPSKSWGTEQIFAYMLLSAVLYSPLIAAYNSAYQALGAELTPDYHERANVMGYKAIVQKTVGILIGAAVWLSGLPLFRDPATGEIDSGMGAMAACTLAGFLMIASGVINVLYVPERYYATATRHEQGRRRGDAAQHAELQALPGVARRRLRLRHLGGVPGAVSHPPLRKTRGLEPDPGVRNREFRAELVHVHARGALAGGAPHRAERLLRHRPVGGAAVDDGRQPRL